jgi:hypothetical protein
MLIKLDCPAKGPSVGVTVPVSMGPVLFPFSVPSFGTRALAIFWCYL